MAIPPFEKINDLLPHAFLRDRIAAQKRLQRLGNVRKTSPSGDKIEKELAHLTKKLQQSIKKKHQRIRHAPSLNYNKALPIYARKDEIIEAIQQHPVVIISGETGSGKTTQIPKFCLDAGRGIEGKIGCTQPRRIAATTVAKRISEEFDEPAFKSVGYKIRFQDKTLPNAYIKIMTDGILLAETQGDPLLNAYDTLIIDEAHERSLNIDFILGILKNLLKKRNDLKLIITSATIDTKKFSKAFGNAPVIEVSGRMYPVEVQYLSMEHADENSTEQTHVELAVTAVDKLLSETVRGDILLFMPTEQDIRETCELIEGRKNKGITVFPLFARLPGREQSRIFNKTTTRKIIVSTNIAETSVTIPGIKFVIDTGLARISQYLPRSRTTSLSVKPISRSSADQRKGRCGRVENGVCIRLYSEDDYNNRPFFTPPEILRANLAEVILRMISLNLGHPVDFPFIDTPGKKAISDGFELLNELGAIEVTSVKKRKNSPMPYALTQRGILMARLPIDPRLSRMLIEASQNGCLKDMIVIASALSVQDPWERPAEKTREADEEHGFFRVPASDFMTLLNVWNQYHRTREQHKTTASMKRFCKTHFLSYRRMREWQDVHAQISAILREQGIRGKRPFTANDKDRSVQPQPDGFDPRYAAIHRSILSGFLSNIARKKNKNIFQAAKDREVMVFPGSVLFNNAGTWIVAAEMVETSRLFARIAANIDNQWLEALGKSQCKYTYQNPHWSRNRGEVVASEQVTLFGLIIHTGRPVSYGRINPKDASEIFIRNALVAGDVKKPFPFMKHNQDLIDSIQDMESRIRRRDIMITDEEIVWFYQDRLGECYDIRSLQHHLKKKGNDRHLRMKIGDLVRYSPDHAEFALFPEKVMLGNHLFDLDYQFDPGKPDDGLTIKIPAAKASEVPRDAIDWLVPGLYREKIQMLIKGLPKSYRKQLVPISGTVDTIIREMPRTGDALLTALGRFIYQRFGVDIPASAWSETLLPDYLKARISIRGPQNEEIRSGRNPGILNGSAQDTGLPDAVVAAKNQWEKTGLTRWDFGDLPTEIIVNIAGNVPWVMFPGLEKSPKDPVAVNLRLFQDKHKAVNSHLQGVVVLYTHHLSKDLKFLKRHLSLGPVPVHRTPWLGSQKQIEQRLYHRVIRNLFSKNIRTENEFYDYGREVASTMLEKGKEFLDKVVPVIHACNKTSDVLQDLQNTHRFNNTIMKLLEDLKGQLIRLIPDTFIDLYDDNRFVHLIRYLKAIEIRAQRALINIEKDLEKSLSVQSFSDRLNDMLADLSPAISEEKKAALEAFFWMIEEYKVSLFAQELKTDIPVSQKRLETKLGEIQRMV